MMSAILPLSFKHSDEIIPDPRLVFHQLLIHVNNLFVLLITISQ